MTEVIAWCFHSPRRLLAVAVVVLGLVIVVGVMLQAASGRGETGPRTSSAGVGVADAGPATEAAVTFTGRWASKPAGQTAEQWREGLSGLVTPELAGGLALTDPETLPGGGPSGQPVVRFLSVSSALIEVPLSSGRHVLVTVVLANGRWLVSDVQPLAGNAGDEAGPSRSAPVAGSSGA